MSAAETLPLGGGNSRVTIREAKQELAAQQRDVAADLMGLVPQTVSEAKRALLAMQRDVDAADTYEAIKRIERVAEATKILCREVEDVRQQAEMTILLAKHRIGTELANVPMAKGTRGTMRGKDSSGAPLRDAPEDGAPSLAQQVGSQKRGLRLKALARISREALQTTAKALWGEGKEATPAAVMKTLAGEETKKRREESRAAQPIPDGMDLRIGDCRTVLADIEPNSVPLILTDPPYGDEAEPLYTWLAEWAARVLIPGGSLICYTGQSKLDRDFAIFGKELRYWWLMTMLHDQSQRLAGKFVIANSKPVLWYVKGFRRGRTLVPDLLKSPARDKLQHAWGQGDGGIGPIIEHLTQPGELIVDPFAGGAGWGRRAHSMGRLWIGADLAAGGTETVKAGE
jgi:hypothetical protein